MGGRNRGWLGGYFGWKVLRGNEIRNLQIVVNGMGGKFEKTFMATDAHGCTQMVG